MQVRFGEFIVDTDRRQLRQGETERHVSPKAFEFLCLLLQNRPRALSKAELHERLWPSTFVSDATLTSLVAEVRRHSERQRGTAVSCGPCTGLAMGSKASPRRCRRTDH